MLHNDDDRDDDDDDVDLFAEVVYFQNENMDTSRGSSQGGHRQHSGNYSSKTSTYEHKGRTVSSEDGVMVRGKFVRDSMRNTFSDTTSEHNSRPGSSHSHDRAGKKHSQIKPHDGRSSSKGKSSQSQQGSKEGQKQRTSSVSKKTKRSDSPDRRGQGQRLSDIREKIKRKISSRGKSHTAAGQVGVNEEDDDQFFHPDNVGPRPRLSSMEPGTRRDSFHLPESKNSSS